MAILALAMTGFLIANYQVQEHESAVQIAAPVDKDSDCTGSVC